MGHKHEARQPSGTRPPWRGTPAQRVASSRKTWQDNECSRPRRAEGEDRRGLWAMHTPKHCCQPRAVCSLQSPVGLEPLQQCRREALGAHASCTAQEQTHSTCILSLRAASSPLSLKGHQQRSCCPSPGGGDSGLERQTLVRNIMAVLGNTKTSIK